VGMRVGYLSVSELARHSRDVAKKYRLEKLQHCAARVRITQLKIKWPTLREMAKSAFADGNVVKLC
jgi:hypothetical protein